MHCNTSLASKQNGNFSMGLTAYSIQRKTKHFPSKFGFSRELTFCSFSFERHHRCFDAHMSIATKRNVYLLTIFKKIYFRLNKSLFYLIYGRIKYNEL